MDNRVGRATKNDLSKYFPLSHDPVAQKPNDDESVTKSKLVKMPLLFKLS